MASKPPEAGGGEGALSPRPLQGSMPLPTPRFQTSGLQSCATINLRFEAALSAALGSRHIRFVFLPCSDHHLPSHAFFSSAYPQHPHWHTSLGKPRPGLHHASVTRPGVYVFFRELFIECLLCARSCCKCWGDSRECERIKILSSLTFTFYKEETDDKHRLMMSAMEKNMTGREVGSLAWAAVIIRVDRGHSKEVTVKSRLEQGEAGSMGMGRSVVPNLGDFAPRRHLAIFGDMEVLQVASG